MDLARLARGVMAATVAAGGLLSGFATQAGPAFAETPMQFVTGVQVVVGDSPNLSCSPDYVKDAHDLNHGSSGKYVFACVRKGTDPAKAIEELYVARGFPDPECYGDDFEVEGDLNAGVHNGLFYDEAHEAMSFCIHRAGQFGGSARIPVPVESRNDFFATPQGVVLTDLKFMEYGATDWPTCTDECADTGVGALGYVEMARAWDSRCQGNFGLDYHPIFGEYEYYSASKDQGARVPKDAYAFNLNAASTGAPMIYACGRYDAIRYITADITTSDNRPYRRGSWTNQTVRVIFTCGTAHPYPIAALSLHADTANQTVTSDGQCLDVNGQQAPQLSFGPINIDTTPPVLQFTGNSGTFTIDQPINIACAANDPVVNGASSGVVSSVCPSSQGALAYTLGVGAHTLTATATDKAGNTGTATANFTVVVTPDSLANVAQVLLGSTNPFQAQAVASFMSQARNPAQRVAAVKNMESYLSAEVGQALVGDAARSAQTIIVLSKALLPSVVNDTDPGLQYGGGGWGYYTPRGVGDVKDDVHATTNDGDSVSYTFTGSAVSFVTEKSLDEGPVDVYLDGALQSTVNAYAPVHNQANQVLYSSATLAFGQHTLKLVKRGGSYLLLDALNVFP